MICQTWLLRFIKKSVMCFGFVMYLYVKQMCMSNEKCLILKAPYFVCAFCSMHLSCWPTYPLCMGLLKCWSINHSLWISWKCVELMTLISINNTSQAVSCLWHGTTCNDCGSCNCMLFSGFNLRTSMLATMNVCNNNSLAGYMMQNWETVDRILSHYKQEGCVWQCTPCRHKT